MPNIVIAGAQWGDEGKGKFVDLLAGVDPTLAGAATPALRKGAGYLHINTTTLACLDEHPGTIEGFGPVIADMARQTVAQMASVARWIHARGATRNATRSPGATAFEKLAT